MNKLSQYLLGDASIRYRATIWLVSFCAVVFLIWAKNAPLDVIVRGPGEVIPSSKTQIVQSLEGGILSEMRVREGDEVPAGSVVALLSDTKFKGAYLELKNEYRSLEIKLARLDNELKKQPSFEPEQSHVDADSKVTRSEIQLFNARMREYESTRGALTEAASLRKDETRMLANMAYKGVVPEIDVIKARQNLGDTEAKLAKLDTEFMMKRSEEYADTLNEMRKLEQTLSIREDQLKRTTLIAPVRSIVNKVHVNTIGGVVAPGEEILELTPLDDELLIEAKINPKDVAFVYPGMPATIKFTAYDYTIYGSFAGRVKHISADTFEEETSREATPYYKVEVEVDQQTINRSGKDIVVRPGMLADAELQVGKKTVLEYLLKPLFKTTEALREP